MKEVGWYLYDLVQYPVKKEALERASEVGVPGLAKCIEEYEPEAIVSIVRRIEKHVRDAARIAGSNATIHSLPFPLPFKLKTLGGSSVN
jgi:hypothetical protein